MSDARLPINHWDTGKVSRDKINDSFNDLVETVAWYRPHIENWIWWIWETNTWVKARGDSVEMKVEDWYIRYKSSSVNNWTQIIAIEDLKWDKWDQWDAATITVWSTTTWAAWSSASVENVGTSWAAIFNFTIPRWAKWEPWQDWEDWQDWENATIKIWTTTTGEPWTDASVTNTGTSTAAVLNFTIPEWAKWDPWQDGEDGNWISSVTATKNWKTTTVTMNYTSWEPTVFQVQDWADWQGSGDMNASTYDPTGKMADAFDYDNMYNTPTIPSTAADVWALPDTTKYWANLSLTINSSTYVVTAQLKDQNWNNLWTAQTIDLPLESVVVSGSYDSATKKVVLTLQSGSTIEFSVADLVAWLQSEITSTNKLDSDLVDDTNQTHKFVTATEKSTWNWKQDTLVSWTNIKTVNNTSLLGSWNIVALWSSNNTYDNIIHLSQSDFDNLGNYDDETLYSTPDGEAWSFVDNTAFWPSWDGVVDKAPSMNAVYDVLGDVETLLANL